jgi:DNA-binding NarL/FixJ family response regulator
MVSDVRPDIVVMDVQLGGDDGVEVTAQLTARHEDLRVVILTAHASRDLMRRAIAARACGLLPKNGALPDLLRTLRSARRGGFVVDPRLFQSLLEKPEDPLPALTPRELMVLRQLAAGKDTTTVARQLGLSVHTCRGYVKSLLVKLDAHSQLEAVAIAIRRGIVDV